MAMRDYIWTEKQHGFYRVTPDTDIGDVGVTIIHGMHPDHSVFLSEAEIDTIKGELLARHRRTA